jgi:amino acid transporter
MFGYLGGMTLSMPRMLFALARDGWLPPVLAAVHPEYRSPHVSIVVQSTVALALAITGTFERLAILANVSALVLYFGCALAAWELRRRAVQLDGAGFRIPMGSVIPWLAAAVILWLLTGLTREEWFGFGVCLAVASLVYAATALRRPAR